MLFQSFAYHFFLHFVQRKGLFHIFLCILYIVIYRTGSFHRMNNRRYRRRRHRCHKRHISLFRHQIMYHLLQFRYFLSHIKQNRIKNLTLALEVLTVLYPEQSRKPLRVLHRKIPLQNSSVNFPIGLYYRNLLCYILQLAYITRPWIGKQYLLGIFRQLNGRHTVFLCKITGKFTEQQ